MTFSSRSRLSALTLPALVLLAACGSSASASPTASVATARPPATATPPVAALPDALAAADIAGSGPFTQKSDGLLGGLANTDARVFANADRTMVVEVDLVADTAATRAASDYPPYQSAAAKQVGTQSSTWTPSLGQQSNEYVGTNSTGKNVVSISFTEGRYIAVVTTVASSAVTADAVKSSAESIAHAQDSKINGIGS